MIKHLQAPCLALFATVGAFGQNVCITGNVTTLAGFPIMGLRVEIMNDTKYPVRKYFVPTDAKGHYFYGGLPPGSYHVFLPNMIYHDASPEPSGDCATVNLTYAEQFLPPGAVIPPGASPFNAAARQAQEPAVAPLPQPPKPGEPSLAETTDWLATVLSGFYPLQWIDEADHITNAVQYGVTAKFTGCTMNVDVQLHLWGSTGIEQVIRGAGSVKLSTIPASPGAINFDSTGSIFSAFSFTKGPPLKLTLAAMGHGTYDGSAPNLPSQHSQTTVVGAHFLVNDGEMAGRISRALAHASLLCGGKAPPF